MAAAAAVASGVPAQAAVGHRYVVARHHHAHYRSREIVTYRRSPDFAPPYGLGGGILSGDGILDSGYFDGFGLPGAPTGQGALGLGFFGL